MKSSGRKISTLVVGAMLCVAAQAKMPPNSYLVATQDTVQGLIGQVNKYPVVLDRYERHFGMTKSEIELYFSTLRLVKLDQSGSYLVYNVPEQTGELRSRVLNLKKGTKIWIDNQGAPTLQWICGNPMTRGPRVVASLSDFQTPQTIEQADPAAEHRDPTMDPTDVARTDDTVPVAKEIEPSTPALATMTPNVTTPEVANIPIEAVNGPAAMLPGAGSTGGFNLGNLFGLPFLGGIIYGAGNSGHGNGPTVSPVPEPTTILALGLGATVLLRKRNKKS